jgi:DNA-binding PadR family transcriptional regulator
MQPLIFLAPALYSENDNQKGLGRRLFVLETLYRNHFTCAEIIKGFLNIETNHHYKILDDMVKEGLIKKCGTPHPVVRNVYILTRKGAEFLQHHCEQLIDNPMTDASKIGYATLAHTIAVQVYGIHYTDPETPFLTEAEIRKTQQAGQKVPDFLFRNELGYDTAVEIELTPKKLQQAEIMLSHSLESIAEERFDNVHIISHSDAILNRYVELMNKETISLWRMNRRSRKWYHSNGEPIFTQRYRGRVSLIKDVSGALKKLAGAAF